MPATPTTYWVSSTSLNPNSNPLAPAIEKAYEGAEVLVVEADLVGVPAEERGA